MPPAVETRNNFCTLHVGLLIVRTIVCFLGLLYNTVLVLPCWLMFFVIIEGSELSILLPSDYSCYRCEYIHMHKKNFAYVVHGDLSLIAFGLADCGGEWHI